MTAPKSRRPLPGFDPAATYPQDYQQGVDSANRLIERPLREGRALFVRHALELVTRHMENWPDTPGKNGVGDRQWARSAGFAHTLREFREAQGS
jgi:hypothetical protein